MRRLPWIVVMGAICCAGCGDDAPSAQPSRPPRASTAPALAAADAAQQAADAEFRYDPASLRDPFRSYVRTETDDPFQAPLERFDLSQLTVTAIVWGTDEGARALIRDPAGKGYIVTPGTIVGKNKGRIIAIEDNSITVKETYVDALGRAATKAVEMRLREGVGG
jgi:type IV pilus assembly protein PilP